MRIVFQTQYICRRERGTQFMIKLPVFKKKKCSYLNKKFLVSFSDGNTVPKIKITKFFWRCDSPQTSNCIWGKPNLFANTSLCSDSSQYATFSKSFRANPRIKKKLHWQICFTSRIDPDILIKVFEDYRYIIFLIWAAWALVAATGLEPTAT